LKEPEINLKRCATQTLSYISLHSEDLAKPIAEKGLDIIASLLSTSDMQLKRNICMLLANLTKHSMDLTNLVTNSINKEQLLKCLKDPDSIVRKNAAFCFYEIVNKSQENALELVSIGGVAALVDYISNVQGDTRLFGILALGFIANYEERSAMSIIKTGRAISALRDALNNETNQHIKAATCYSLGNIGKHSPGHADELTEQGVLPLILYYYMSQESTDDLRSKAKDALFLIITACSKIKILDPLIQVAPKEILKKILERICQCLKNSTNDKVYFLKNGGLKRVLEMRFKFENEKPNSGNIEEDEKETKLNMEINNIIAEIASPNNYESQIVTFLDPLEKEKALKDLNKID